MEIIRFYFAKRPSVTQDIVFVHQYFDQQHNQAVQTISYQKKPRANTEDIVIREKIFDQINHFS